jgi:hypothetical protein
MDKTTAEGSQPGGRDWVQTLVRQPNKGKLMAMSVAGVLLMIILLIILN